MNEDLRRLDDERYLMLQKQVSDICGDLRNIKENHLAHIERNTANVMNDMEWIKRFFWIIATSSISALVASLFTLIQDV
jgi:hypothetical protein